MISALQPIQPSHQTAIRPAVARSAAKAAGAAAAATTTPAATTTTTTPGLANESTFLTLLVTQLQYQDPLNPADSTQFVTQLAQFSQLEDLQNINQNGITISNSVTAAAAAAAAAASAPASPAAAAPALVTPLSPAAAKL